MSVNSLQEATRQRPHPAAGYGRGIVIYRVIDLTPISYKEEEIHRIYPTDPFYRDGIHTLNINKEVTVVDGYRLRYNPFVKVIKKLR